MTTTTVIRFDEPMKRDDLYYSTWDWREFEDEGKQGKLGNTGSEIYAYQNLISGVWPATEGKRIRIRQEFNAPITVTSLKADLAFKGGTGHSVEFAVRLWQNGNPIRLDETGFRLDDLTSETWEEAAWDPVSPVTDVDYIEWEFSVGWLGHHDEVRADNLTVTFTGGIPDDPPSEHECGASGACGILFDCCNPIVQGIGVGYPEKVIWQNFFNLSPYLNFAAAYVQTQQANPDFQFMGLGWTHNQAVKLSLAGSSPDRTAEVRWEDGAIIKFEEISAGNFQALPGSGAIITAISSNYVLELVDGSTFTFDDSTLELSERAWANGETLSYSYSSGRLTRVEDDYGNELHFAYVNNPSGFDDGQLWRVGDHTSSDLDTSPTGRYLEFAYSPEKANGSTVSTPKALLTSIQDVMAEIWSYDYYGQDSGESTSELLNLMVRQLSPSVDTTGDGTPDGSLVLEELSYTVSGGQITHITQNLGGQETVFAYQPDDEPITTQTSGGLVTTHRFSLYEGEIGVYLGTDNAAEEGGRKRLNSDYRATKQTDARGNKTLLSWSNGGKSLDSVEDALGNTTSFAYNDNHTLTSSTDADGRQTLYFYAPNQLRQAKYRLVMEGNDLAVNGDMQADSDWTDISGSAPQTNARSSTQVNTGTYARRVVANAANQGIEGAEFDLVEDQPYVMVAQVYPVSGVVKMGVNGTSDFDAVSAGTGAWQTLLVRHTPSGAASDKKLQFTASGGSAEFYVDSVLIIEGDLLDWQVSTYDAKGRTLTEQSLDPQDGVTVLRETTRTYYSSGDGAGLLESVTQADIGGSDDVTTTYFYDEVGRVIQVNQSSNFGSCSKSRTLYDAAGKVVASICNYDPEASGVTSFSSSNHPDNATEASLLQAETTDPEVNQVTIHEYDSLGRRIKTTANPGESYAQASVTVYDALNRVVRSIANFDGKDTNGDTITHPYTADRNLFRHSAGSEINTRNLITETLYNARGLVRKQVDVQGNVTLMGYDEADRLVKTISFASQASYDNDYSGDPDLSAYTLSGEPDEDLSNSQEYDPNGNLAQSTDSLGKVTLMGYDALNRVVKTIRSASQTSYAWGIDPDLSNYPANFSSDADQISTSVFDALGRVRITTDPSGEVTLYGYDGLGRTVRTIRNASQPTYDWAVDPDLSDYAISQAADEDILSLTTYDTQGRTLFTTDVNGQNTWLAYDGLGRQIKTIVNAQGTATDGGSDDPRSSSYVPSSEVDEDFISQTHYDAEGRVKWTLDTLGRYTLFGYDNRNRRVRVVRNASNPSYNTVSDPDLSGYTPSGQPDEDQISQTVYDSRGRVWKTIDTRANETVFEYDELGRRVKTTTNYVNGVYNASYTDEDLISTSVYDLAGRVWKTVDPAERETRFEFDNAGRRVKTTTNYVNGVFNASYPDEDLISITAYNIAGQVVSTQDARGTLTTFTYDDLGRRITTTTAANTPLAATSTTVYDQVGRVIQQIDPLGEAMTYAYDRLGRRVRQTNALGHEALTAYHKDGRVKWTSDPEGTVTLFIYDQARRLVWSIQGYLPVQSTAQNQIIFDLVDEDPNPEQIYQIQPNGSNLTLISDDEFARQGSADLSPDGTHLVVVADPENVEGVYVMEVGGDNPELLHLTIGTPLGYLGAPKWSPEGDWIYFSSWVGDDIGIYRVRPDGIDKQLYYHKAGYALTALIFSPDGTRIALTGYPISNPSWADIYTLDRTGQLFNVTSNAAKLNFNPAWTPDGLNLIFHAKDSEGWRQIWRISATGQNLQQLTFGEWNDRNPSLSADGSQIAFISDRDGPYVLYVMDADGSNQTALPTNSDKDYAPVWVKNVIDPATWLWSGANNRWENGLGNPIPHGDSNDRNLITDYTYDKAGRRLSMTDPRHYTTTYTYDDLNRRLTITNPLSQTWTTAYTDLGGGGYKITLTDPLTYATERVFDRVGRLTEINYNHASTPDVSFTYDAAGNRRTMSEENGALIRETLYTYDEVNRLTQVDLDTDGDTLIEETVQYAYDAGGLRTRLTVDGLDVIYEYDGRGRLVKLTDWDDQDTLYTYDLMGRVKTVRRANGVLTTYHYDHNGRLKDLHHTKNGATLKRFAYQLDKRGNRLQTTEVGVAGSGSTETIFSDDERIHYQAGTWVTSGAFEVSANHHARLELVFFGQDISVTLGNGTDHGICDVFIDGFLWGSRDLYSSSASEETFTISCYTDTQHTLTIQNRLDKNLASSGRKLSLKEVEVDTAYGVQNIAYSYDALSRVTNAAYYDGQTLTGTPTREYTYTYDRASNRTNETLDINGSQQYSHDFSYNGANQLTNSGFTYDNNGNLTHDGTNSYSWDRANRLTSHNGSTYTYNGVGQRVSQTVSSIVTQYLQDTQPALYQVIKTTAGATTERFVHDPMGIHTHENGSGDWSWFLTDGLGSIRDVRDETGASVFSVQYGGYGDVFDAQGTNPTDYDYTGQWRDAKGLLYLRNRYYDPVTGVFISQDPLELANRYGYVDGNPIMFTDPLGLETFPKDFAGNCQESGIPCFPQGADRITRSGSGIELQEWALRLLSLIVSREAPNHPEQWKAITHIFLNRLVDTADFANSWSCGNYTDTSQKLVCLLSSSSCANGTVQKVCPNLEDTVFGGALLTLYVNDKETSCRFYDEWTQNEITPPALNEVRQAVRTHNSASPFANYYFFRHPGGSVNVDGLKRQACVQRAYHVLYTAYQAYRDPNSAVFIANSQALFAIQADGLSLNRLIEERGGEVYADVFGSTDSPILLSNIGLTLRSPGVEGGDKDLQDTLLQVRLGEIAPDWQLLAPYDYESLQDCLSVPLCSLESGCSDS